MIRINAHKLKYTLLYIIIAGLCFSTIIKANDVTKIAIITGDELTSTKRTIKGALKIISSEHIDNQSQTFIISNDNSKNLIVLDSIKATQPDLVLTVGSSATKFAKDHFENTPIVFSSVKYPLLSGFVESLEKPGSNITGASIDIPLQIQFEKFKEIIPNLKKIGVLYTINTEPLIPHAKIIAASIGLELVAVKVNSDKELPEALDSLAKSVQGIWSVADHNLFKPKSTRYILLNTLKKRIPFMGFSKYVVESGALFALDFDYKAVGIQAGEIANRILNGEKPNSIKVTSANVIWFHYNEKTSQRIHIPIPDELASIAREVYR